MELHETKNKESFFKWFKKGVESMFEYFNAPKFYNMNEFWEEYREKFEDIYNLEKNEKFKKEEKNHDII